MTYIKKLYESLPTHMRKVIDNLGGPLDYVSLEAYEMRKNKIKLPCISIIS